MTLAWIVYLMGVLGAMTVVLTVGFVVSVITTILLGAGLMAATIEGSEEDIEKVKRMLKPALKAFAVVGVLAVIVPSERTAYTMLAAYGVEEIVTSDKAQELGGKSLQVIEQFLDEKLKEQ